MKTLKSETKIVKPLLSYQILKFFGEVYLMWPSEREKGSFNRLFYEICWWLFLSNDICLFFQLSISLYNVYRKLPTLITTLCTVVELVIIIEKIYATVNFKICRLKFKKLIEFLELSVGDADSKEAFLLKQMRPSKLINFIHWTIYSLVIFFYIYLHTFRPTLILPKEIWFPFSIDPISRKYLVLFQQAIFISRIGVLNVADELIFMVINNASVKLKILSENFTKVNNNSQLKKCIREHQEILTYIKEINSTLRFFTLKIVLTGAFYLIIGSLQLVYVHEKVALALWCQFLALVVHINYRVYYTASCAETLATMGTNLKLSIPWRKNSTEIASSLSIIIMQRCQIPLYISVSGIMPQFSLQYYGKFLYFIVSYFLTIKALLKSKIESETRQTSE